MGYRQFPSIRNGRNAREQDVEHAWSQVVAGMIAASPDLILIAGDVFHRARVSGYAIEAWLTGLSGLLAGTDATIHVVNGNHESARTSETRCPNNLAEVLDSERICIYDTASVVEDTDYQLTALPFESGGARKFQIPEKIPGKVNILVIHGAIQAPGINKYYADEKCPHIDHLARHFDVIAAGDLHDHTLLENDHGCIAAYSGSIEYTSTNFWPEDRKGFVLIDTEERTTQFQPIKTRAVRDLVADDCTDAEALNIYLAALRESPTVRDLDEPIVRVVVPGFDRAERAGIDHSIVRAIKAQCLHFQLDIRTVQTGASGKGEASRGRSLRDMADEFFSEAPPKVRDRALSLIDERWV